MSEFVTASRPSGDAGRAASTASFRVHPVDRVDLPDLESPQLPVRSYFDPAVHEAEVRHLFARGPGYVGHDLMIPEAGDYHVLSWKNDGQALVRERKGKREAEGQDSGASSSRGARLATIPRAASRYRVSPVDRSRRSRRSTAAELPDG